MKICSHCGTVMPDENVVCAACGMVLPAPQVSQETQVLDANHPAAQPVAPQAEPVAQPAAQPAYVPPTYVPPAAPPAVNYMPVQVPKISVSMWGWIGRYALNLIPLVGGLVYFIMLFVWAFDTKYDDTSRNWAKSMLLLAAIGAVLGLLLVILMFALGLTAADVINESMYY